MPSELVRLRWTDVDWDRGRITIYASKTEHHEDSGIRVIPLFPELRGPLLELFDLAETGTVSVFPNAWGESSNLRTRLETIIKRAGLTPWPKLWQNLRSTRETELFEKYPAHVAAAWIGNTVKVALEHYTQLRDEYYVQAVETGDVAQPDAPGGGGQRCKSAARRRGIEWNCVLGRCAGLCAETAKNSY